MSIGFTTVDTHLHNAMTQWPALTALVPVAHIYRRTRDADIRPYGSGQTLRPHIEYEPQPVRFEHRVNNTRTRATLEYRIILTTAGASLDDNRAIEQVLIAALLQFCEIKDYDGNVLPAPAPYVYNDAIISPGVDVRYESEGEGPKQWKSLIGLKVIVEAPTANIIGWTAAAPVPLSGIYVETIKTLTMTFDRPLKHGFVIDATKWAVHAYIASVSYPRRGVFAIQYASTVIVVCATTATPPLGQNTMNYTGTDAIGANGLTIAQIEGFPITSYYDPTEIP